MKRRRSNAEARRRLLARRDGLLQDARRQVSNALECRTAHADRGDLASCAQDEEVAAAVAESESAEADEIDEALEQLDAGRYGRCQSCGKRITRTRLEAVPWATLCTRCQRRQEARPEPQLDETDSHWERVAAIEAYEAEWVSDPDVPTDLHSCTPGEVD